MKDIFLLPWLKKTFSTTRKMDQQFPKFLFVLITLILIKLFSESILCNASNCSAPVDGRLFLETMNPSVINAEYAVRGEVLLRANEVEKFRPVIYCNIGNPQSLGQKPLTFTRRVLSLLLNPEDLNRNDLPRDVIERAKKYLKMIKNGAGVGAYSDSQGILGVREEVARFISRRDGYSASPDDIFLTSGASSGVEFMLRTIIRTSDDALIIPIPQYPLYSATVTLLDGHFEGYELNEESGWETQVDSILSSLKSARNKGKIPRALVVINPGNPVGSTLSETTIRQIIELCRQEKLILLADEVYQENVYSNHKKFTSFRKSLLDLRAERNWKDDEVQLVSIHSISKGVSGECGLRGGYFELQGFNSEVKFQIYKLTSISLCPNVPGQFAVALMVSPPKEGEESFELDQKERNSVFQSLKRRALKISADLNKLEGVSCQSVEGAMYAFPKLELPNRFVQEAHRVGKHPDTLYSLHLLEETGIVVVPGNGFGEKDGTYHFRTTILPPEDLFDEVLKRFRHFHEKFMIKWRD